MRPGQYIMRRGQSMTERQLVDRLNDLGYTLRARADRPGEFAMATSLISIMPRAPELKGKLVRVVFPKPPPPGKTAAARAPSSGQARRWAIRCCSNTRLSRCR